MPDDQQAPRMSKGQAWAVVCGSVRHPHETVLVINDLIAMREQGLIAGIVLSSWTDDLEVHADLAEALNQRNILIVRNAPLMDGGEGNTLRQQRLLLSGMRACPFDCNILKVRTDKCITELACFAPYLERGLEPVDKSVLGALPAVLDHRVVVRGISTTMPFNIEDVIFFATRRDMEQLINFDQYADIIALPKTVNAEMRYYCLPFLRRFPILQAFYETVNCRGFSTALMCNFQSATPRPLPSFFAKVFSLYAILIASHFEAIRQQPLSAPPSSRDSLTMTTLFGGGGWDEIMYRVPITFCDLMRADHMAPFRRVVDGKIEATDGGVAVQEGVATWLQVGAGWALGPTDAEMDELTEFLTANQEDPADILSRPLPVSGTGKAETVVHHRPLDADFQTVAAAYSCTTAEAAELSRMLEHGGMLATFHRIALMHLADTDQPDRVDKAVQWLERCAEMRHNPSVVLLARIKLEQNNPRHAKALLVDAAKRSDEEALALLSSLGWM